MNLLAGVTVLPEGLLEERWSDRMATENWQIQCALNPPRGSYFSGILALYWTNLNHISRMLSKHIIKTVGIPPRKAPSFFWPIKDDLVQKLRALYDCGMVYIGQIDCSV
jgi:hypothetical protein